MGAEDSADTRVSAGAPGLDEVLHGGLSPCRNYRLELEDGCRRAAATRTIQRLSRDIGLRAIAEGLETQGQRRSLIGKGVVPPNRESS